MPPRPSPHTQQHGSGHGPSRHPQPPTATWGCAINRAWLLTHREDAQPPVLGREGPPTAPGPEDLPQLQVLKVLKRPQAEALGSVRWDTGKAGRPFRLALAWSRHGLLPWCVCGPRTHVKQHLEGPCFPSPLSRPTERARISRVSLWGTPQKEGERGFTQLRRHG